MPTPNGSDDFIRISRPGERLGTRIGFSDVPVDGLLKIDHRTEEGLSGILCVRPVPSLADEPFAEDDGELGPSLEPFARRSFPFVRLAIEDQI